MDYPHIRLYRVQQYKKQKLPFSMHLAPIKQNTNTNTLIIYARVMKLQSMQKQWVQVE